MMKHPDEPTLHLHIDDELPTADRWAVEAHLKQCADCTARADELRSLVARMGQLRAEIQPPVDLWAGIAQRIQEVERPVSPARSIASRRKIYLGIGWITAIAATLALGIGLGRMAERNETLAGAESTELPGSVASAPVPAADSEETVALLATAHEEPAYDTAISDLESVIEESSDQLRPETVAVIEENLAIIDQAIAEAEAALEADPANEHLHQHIASNKQMKLRLLRTMSAAVPADI